MNFQFYFHSNWYQIVINHVSRWLQLFSNKPKSLSIQFCITFPEFNSHVFWVQLQETDKTMCNLWLIFFIFVFKDLSDMTDPLIYIFDSVICLASKSTNIHYCFWFRKITANNLVNVSHYVSYVCARSDCVACFCHCVVYRQYLLYIK